MPGPSEGEHGMLQTSIGHERESPARRGRKGVSDAETRGELEEKYRKVAEEYRRDDEIEVRTDHHCWIWKTLSDLCSSFEREISVLDAGCGTGRHFHCLKDVKRLVGLDLSPEMLRAAQAPIRQEMISPREVELVCGDFHSVSFPSGSFDLIYSLGMFGYGCELTVDVLNRFREWLTPGGLLFFDISNSSGVQLDLRMRAALRKILTPMLPARARKPRDVQFHHVSRRQLARLLRQSAFCDWEIYRRPCHSPCWSVDKFECLAARGELSPELVDTLRFRASAPLAGLA